MTDRASDPAPAPRRKTRLLAVALVAAVAGGGVTALLVNIFEHKQEAKSPFFREVELDDQTEDPEVWGKNFPLQYDGYLRTVDQIRTRFGGSEAIPRTPTAADPRSIVSESRLEEDPRLRTMWAGYAFAVDFREERGHANMLDDQTFTERQQAAKQPGTCLHCHASMYVPYKKAGGGDLIKGFERMNPLPYFEARKLVMRAVSCIVCHDPSTKSGIHHLLWPDEIARKMGPFLQGMRDCMLVDVIDYVSEGEAMLAEMVAGLIESRPEQVRAVFLGYAEIDVDDKVALVKRHGDDDRDWLTGQSDEYIRDHIRNMVGYSRMIKRECERDGVPYFDTSLDFHGATEAAANFLVDDLS